MRITAGVVTGLIATLVLSVAFAFAEQSGSQQSQQSDPSMQQESQQQQGAMAQDPETIKQVQQALSNQGYNAGPADGKMGSKTKSALKKFQESQGMQASGNLDQQTLAALGVSGGAAAGGQEGGMQEQQSGAGGQQEDMEKQEDMQKQESGAGAGGQQDMQSQPSDQQSGGKY